MSEFSTVSFLYLPPAGKVSGTPGQRWQLQEGSAGSASAAGALGHGLLRRSLLQIAGLADLASQLGPKPKIVLPVQKSSGSDENSGSGPTDPTVPPEGGGGPSPPADD